VALGFWNYLGLRPVNPACGAILKHAAALGGGAVSSGLLHGFRLGTLMIEPLTGKVTDPAGSRHMPPKAMQILVCLAENYGDLVTQKMLIEKAWGGGHASAAALSHAVSEIRHALSDHSDNPQFIQTIPKRGYRLLVEPEVMSAREYTATPNDLEPQEPALWAALMKHGVVQAAIAYLIVGWLIIQVGDATFDVVGLPSWSVVLVTYVVIGGFPLLIVFAWFLEATGGRVILDRGSQSGRFFQGLERNYLAIVAAYAIAATGAAIYQYAVGYSLPDNGAELRASIETPELEVDPNSIAVLRFLNIDGSDTTKMFGDGLGEDMLDMLITLPGLSVSARGDSWSLPANAPSELVRQRLRVAYYVEGSIRLVDNTLRIVVQLIDSENGFHIISRSFDRDLEDFMGLQREITSLIVANLRIGLPEDSLAMVAAGGDESNLDAYVLYRRGMDLFNQPHSIKTLDEATGFFDQALELDSGYAAAHAGLCRAFVAKYDIGSDTRFIDPAEAACSSAVATGSKLDVVFTALGDLYENTGRYEDGQTAYERALDINAKSVPAMHGLSVIYENQQRFDEAEALLAEAVRLQPGNWRSMNSLGGFLFVNGRYEEAADAYRMIISLDPNNWQGLGNLGGALLMTGNFEEAATALQRSIELERDLYYLSNLATIYYYLGQFDDSVAIHRESVELFPESDIAWLGLADSLLFSSESGQADAAYQKAAELSEKKLAIDSRGSMTLCRAAWATAMTGRTDRAAEYMRRAIESAPDNPYVHYYDALLKAKSGNYDAALDSLSVALVNGFPSAMLVSEPLLTDIRDLERFSALVPYP